MTELKKRSDYLCALAVSPSWRKRFGTRSAGILRVAMDEPIELQEHGRMLTYRRRPKAATWRAGSIRNGWELMR